MWALGSYKKWKIVVSEKSSPKDYETGYRCVPVKEMKATAQMATPLLRGLFDVVSLCIGTVSIPFFTSKKQRDNEIWCSLHNACIFSLWTTLEPQQDLGQHLLHACLHQLHFQSICRDHSKSTLKASWVFVEVFQTTKLKPWILASFFSGAVIFGGLFVTDILVLGWHQGRMSKASALIFDISCIASHEFKFISLKSVSGV